MACCWRTTDMLAALLPGRDAVRELSRKDHGKRWRPVLLRLVMYTHGATEYVRGTTMLDRRRYRVAALADLYHARWGVEELDKWWSDYPISRSCSRARAVLPPRPPVRWMRAEGPVQPQTA